MATEPDVSRTGGPAITIRELDIGWARAWPGEDTIAPDAIRAGEEAG